MGWYENGDVIKTYKNLDWELLRNRARFLFQCGHTHVQLIFENIIRAQVDLIKDKAFLKTKYYFFLVTGRTINVQ